MLSRRAGLSATAGLSCLDCQNKVTAENCFAGAIPFEFLQHCYIAEK